MTLMAWFERPHTGSSLQFDHRFQVTKGQWAIEVQWKELLACSVVSLNSLEPLDAF